MDDLLTFLIGALVGSAVLLTGVLQRACATAVLHVSSDEPSPAVRQYLAHGVGLFYALLGLVTVAVACGALLVKSDTFLLSAMYFPVGVGLLVALGGAVAVLVAHFRRKPAETDSAAPLAAQPPARDSLPLWLTAGVALLVILGTVILALDSFSLSTEPSPGVLMYPAALGLLLSLTGTLLLKASRQLSRPTASASERERLARALRTLSIFKFIFGAVCWFVPGLFLGILLGLMVLGALAASARASRLTTLWTVSTTLRSGRTLSEELSAQAATATGRSRRSLRRAADDLLAGKPLAQLLYHSGVVPRSCWLEASGGLASGKLPEALRAAAARETARFSRLSTTNNSHYMFGYVGLVCTIMLLIISFIMYYIIPKFKKIFEDFGTELPNATQVLIQISDSIVHYWYLFWPLGAIPLAAIGIEMLALQHGWPEALEQYFGPYCRRLRAPDLLRGLRWAVEARRPLPEALEQMAHAPLPMAYRSRLYHAAKHIERGEDPWRVLCAQGWISDAEADLLRTAQDNQHLAWALETLAQSSQSSRDFRLAALMEFLSPLVLMFVSLFVAAIVYAFFLPLVFLIVRMA